MVNNIEKTLTLCLKTFQKCFRLCWNLDSQASYYKVAWKMKKYNTSKVAYIKTYRYE